MSLAGLFNQRWPGVALFDLDGTLVDSAPDLAAAIDAMLEQLGRRKAGIDNVRQWVGNGAGVLVRRALAGQADWEPVSPKDDALFNDALTMFYHAYENLNGRHAVLYGGVEDCLTRLAAHGCRMGIVTNKPEQFVAPLLEQMGIEHWFDISIGGDTLPVRKPDPQPLIHAMTELGGTRGTTVMVGDSVTDISAALAAGIPSVAVRYGYNYGAPVDSLGADAVVDSLAQLL
ncbi:MULTISPECIES: phosphoglycolate phosphatase [Marinobacter]|jgi:phosphoglycolate phosphatase|uniref:phosphoglycolate phosphatase n=1 Tax=Marinobacter TaxID=2742 RepID=UPI000C8BA550|nr:MULTISPECIES: phosphoglycolate phosphatase [Marinobacter]MAB54022.1 phosphoglycolate phosphatase [Marinobacter sp.]MDM8180541.1 phosphoglycolate phosphatase [Marinobacter salarius]RUT75989.1 phosphoglycolate phosphatase [Marinobacter sp. NP-6]|tara:strand:+ start:577 stop:1266 length:690 start_codon:yes stop_codon:yes gene_type:complete